MIIKRIFFGVRWLVNAKMALLVLAIALVVMLASCGAQKSERGSSKSNPSSHNGKIAFVGSGGLSMVNPDGSGLSKLATKPVEDYFPAWSPDGKRIAFEAANPPSGVEAAYPLSMDPTAPAYSLDLYLVNADGSRLKHITTDPKTHDFNKVMDDRMPSWSPDGTRVAFARLRMEWMRGSRGKDESGIYTIGVDGTGLRQLTDNRGDEYPAFSPDGKKIAFDRLTKATRGIYTVNTEGGGLKRLSDSPKGLWDTAPSWSADGTKIVFDRVDFGSTYDVFLMNSEGTHLRKLTGKTGDAFSPDFSPDGKRIVYVGRKRGSGANLYAMNADGTNIRKLAQTHGGYEPDWQPLP